MPTSYSLVASNRAGTRFAALLTLSAALLAAPGSARAGDGQDRGSGCQLHPGQRGAVQRVVDAETIELDHGSQVRLIGALAPRAPELGAGPPATWQPEQDAHAALNGLVAGRTVELAFGGRQRDRYGRLLAHVFITVEGQRVWVQGELVARGHARAYGLPQSFDCMEELNAHERQARADGLGLWGNANFAPRGAESTATLRRLRGSYQLVVGRVLEVKKTKSVLYLNFGPGRGRDFSAVVPLAHTDRAWIESIAALAGKTVLVRGWLERRAGPFIQIDDRSQVEVVADGSAPRDVAGSARQAISSDGESEKAEAPGSPQADESGRRGGKRKRPARSAPGAVDL